MYRNDYEICMNDEGFAYRNPVAALWVTVSSAVRIWWATRQLSAEVMRERKVLAGLPDHLLQDIGIARAEASAESHRREDDLPQERLRQAHFGTRSLK